MDNELEIFENFLTEMAKKSDVRPVMSHWELFHRTQLMNSFHLTSGLRPLKFETKPVVKNNKEPETSSDTYENTDSNFEGIDEHFEDQNLSQKLRTLGWYTNSFIPQTPRKYCDFERFTNSPRDLICYQNVNFQHIYDEERVSEEKESNFHSRQLETFSSVYTEGVNEERLVPKLPPVNLKSHFQEMTKTIVKER